MSTHGTKGRRPGAEHASSAHSVLPLPHRPKSNSGWLFHPPPCTHRTISSGAPSRLRGLHLSASSNTGTAAGGTAGTGTTGTVTTTCGTAGAGGTAGGGTTAGAGAGGGTVCVLQALLRWV